MRALDSTRSMLAGAGRVLPHAGRARSRLLVRAFAVSSVPLRAGWSGVAFSIAERSA